MISFSIVFFLPFTFLLLRSLSTVSNSLYLSFLPSVSYSFYVTFNAILHRNFGLLRLHFPPLSGHLLSASFSTLPAHVLVTNFFFEIPLTPTSSLMSSIFFSLNSNDYSYQVGFCKPAPSPVVSLLVSSSLVHS